MFITPPDQTGTTSSTGTMVGYGQAGAQISLNDCGNLVIKVSGYVSMNAGHSFTEFGAMLQIHAADVNAVAAPANGATPPANTEYGPPQRIYFKDGTNTATIKADVPFYCVARVPGLNATAPFNIYWVDISLKSLMSPDTVQVHNATIEMYEE